MPRKDIPQFGQAGISVDAPDWQLGPESLTSARNVDISDGRIQSGAGSLLVSAYPASGSDTPLRLMFERDRGLLYWVVAGRSSMWAYEAKGATWGDISNTADGTVTADAIISQAQLSNGITIYNVSEEFPNYWGPVGLGQNLIDLPYDIADATTWRGLNYKARWFTSHRGMLIALNVDKAGTREPSLFKWSHPVAVGQLPDWDNTDPANLSGELTLDGDGGEILCGHVLRDAVAVYKEQAVWLVSPTTAAVGGVAQVWQQRKVLGNVGLISPYGIANYKTQHFLMAAGDIYVFDGTTAKSIVSGKIRKLLNTLIDPDALGTSYALVDYQAKRIHFCFPEYGATFPTIAVIYDLESGAWATRDIGKDARSCAQGIFYQQKWDIADLTFPISSWTDPIGGSGFSAAVQSVGEMPVSGLHVQRVAGNDIGGGELTWKIERTGMQIAGPDQKVTVTDLWIQAQQVNVDLTVVIGGQEWPGGAISWQAPYTFNPSTHRKVSCRCTGNLICVRISGPCSYLSTIAGLSFSYQSAGKR